ncbi:hypothetical protein CVT26_012543 [Gymnopilus dilepis]|uniref:Transcription initiation factor TFIID subunit 4 n=1 Tax=Gymnopilus dilepis TaxID=231916 RepID=A0A409WAL2_9AGAR|nr:hypothetical protein CVT26_012543 [Gymnopilus dilepis]
MSTPLKTEEQTTTPTTQTPATTTPATSYTSTWPSTQMAIDPALQQTSQHTTATASPYYQAYTSHYPQAAYATHYQTYAPPATQSTTQTPARPATTTGQYQTSTYNLGTTTTPATAASTTAASSAGGMDTADIATLNDALGSAGVDLRAEEETLQRSHDTHQPYRAYEDRTRKQPPKPAFDTRILGATMRTIGTHHKITRVPEESVNYLALSLRARLQDLITAMIAASHHRTDTQFDRPASLYEEDKSPMWSIVVRSDVAKQLAVLERIEREEEMRVRKERKERAEMTAAHTAALAAQANGMAAQAAAAGEAAEETEGGPKKKRKKDGPGVTARNMSEDVRKKMSNAVATQAAGLGGKYAWMTAANAASPAPKPKRETTAAATATTTTSAAAGTPTATTTTAATSATPAAAGTSAATAATTTSSWARPYVSKKTAAAATKEAAAEEDNRTVVTMRDAMFVIEKERGHGGGRGAARGWV